MLSWSVPAAKRSKLSAFAPIQLQELKKTDVVAIYLFGSRAQGLEHGLSDYDYAILTKYPHVIGDELYHRLYEILSDISPRQIENDVIDIVYLHEANLELKFHVIRYGKIIYENSTSKRQDFEAFTTILYADYRPILDQMDKAILESL